MEPYKLIKTMNISVYDGNIDKMLSVVDQFEEENVQPSNRTLLYIARECKKTDKELPDHIKQLVEPLLQVGLSLVT